MIKSANRLSQRELILFDHIDRYRMAIGESVAALDHWSELGLKEVRHQLNRLQRRGLLSAGFLDGDDCYFHLSVRSARMLGKPCQATSPLSDAARINSFAILAYCMSSPGNRVRLSLDEFRDRFPTLVRHGERVSYCLETGERQSKLGLVRVDSGGRGRWDRLISRLGQDVQRRCDLPDFRRLLEQDRLVVTVITAFEHKAQRLRESIDERAFPVPVRVHCIPRLINLIAPKPIRTDRP